MKREKSGTLPSEKWWKRKRRIKWNKVRQREESNQRLWEFMEGRALQDRTGRRWNRGDAATGYIHIPSLKLLFLGNTDPPPSPLHLNPLPPCLLPTAASILLYPPPPSSTLLHPSLALARFHSLSLSLCQSAAIAVWIIEQAWIGIEYFCCSCAAGMKSFIKKKLEKIKRAHTISYTRLTRALN